MAKKLDQILVVDVEATCWNGPKPVGQENEIIEIGACLLNVLTQERSHKQRILVTPARSTVSAFCTELTGLTQSEVEQGISFSEACAQLAQTFAAGSRIWASYGEYDKQQFQKECDAKQVAYPFGPQHINVKTLFALVHHLPHEVGMARALDILGIPLEGRHHSGIDDAWNSAAIIARLLWQSTLHA